MKKISKGYRIASALFLIWAIVDFRNYATIGKDLVAYYSIRTLPQAGIGSLNSRRYPLNI